MSTSFLDLFGGPRCPAGVPAARRVQAPRRPAHGAAGLAEWQGTAGGARRVGVVHASENSTATVLYGTSWLARRKRAHRTAVTHGHGDGLVATLGGSFGGHLTLVRKIVTPTPPSVRPAVKTASRVGRGRTMSKPQQPELHRSGLGATDPASAKAAAEVGGAGRVAGATGPVPEDNLPGHHPAQDQDKPEGPPSGAAR